MAKFEGAAMNSILEELRCMDGELFKSEITQRLYLVLKEQALESLRGIKDAKNSKELLDLYAKWGPQVRDEEMLALRGKMDADSLSNLFTQVALMYVRMSHSSYEKKTVKIKTPHVDELVRNFFQRLVSNTWIQNGGLWKLDPIKLDFMFRETFRSAVMDSVHVVEAEKTQEKWDDDVGPDDSVSRFLAPESRHADKRQEPVQDNDSDDEYEKKESSYNDYSKESSYDNATVYKKENSQDNATVYKKSHDSATVYKPTNYDSRTVTGPSRVTSKYETSLPKIVTIQEPEYSDDEDLHIPLSSE